MTPHIDMPESAIPSKTLELAVLTTDSSASAAASPRRNIVSRNLNWT